MVLRASRGDRQAFASLWQRHAGRAHAILLSMVPAQDAEDLLQDIAILTWTRIGDLRDPTRFGPWLGEISRNVGRRALAHRRARDTRPLGEGDEPDPAPPASVAAEADEILATIRGLKECYREPLLMRLLLGMSGPEIAEQLGMTPGSVRVNLCRGMRLLRDLVESR